MNQELRRNKAVIRDFMRAQYTDGRLAQLLDHARSGKLDYLSCCCFIGIVTEDHGGLVGRRDDLFASLHLDAAKRLPKAIDAEQAFLWLAAGMWRKSSDEARRLRIIPIIKAEIRRRMRVRYAMPAESPEAVEVK